MDETDPWREAIERWFIGWETLPKWDEPAWPQINAMIAWEQRVALDPAVSEGARQLVARPPWLPIPPTPTPGVAPFDGRPVLLIGTGADGRPMPVLVHWVHVPTMFKSGGPHPLDGPDCAFVGELGIQYGITFEWWMPISALGVPPLSPYAPLPPPPAEGGR